MAKTESVSRPWPMLPRKALMDKARHYLRAGRVQFLHLLAKHGDSIDARLMEKFSASLAVAQGLTFGGYGLALYEASGVDLSALGGAESAWLKAYVGVLVDAKSIPQVTRPGSVEWWFGEEPPKLRGRQPVDPEEKKDGNQLLQARFEPKVVEWVVGQGGIKSVVLAAYALANEEA